MRLFCWGSFGTTQAGMLPLAQAAELFDVWIAPGANRQQLDRAVAGIHLCPSGLHLEAPTPGTFAFGERRGATVDF